MRFCKKKNKNKKKYMIMNLQLTSNVKIIIIEGLGRVEI